MKNLKFAIVMLGLVLAGKAIAQTDRYHDNVIGIFKTYSANISASLKSQLDSTILATAERFNSNNNSVKVVVNDSSATEQITLDITKGRLATKRQRYVAYLVNLIVPVYIPAHKVKSSMTIPDNGTRSIKSSTHILVGSIEKREEKMLTKYADRLLRELNQLGNPAPEFTSSIR